MDIFVKWKIVRIVITSIYLMAGWILFTATFALFSLVLGGIFSFCIALTTYTLFIEEKEAARRSLLPHAYLMFIYVFVLLIKIYIASFQMVVSVVKGDINPRIVHFRSRLKSDLARTILANSITLTPGTITLDLDDDHLVVHWLNAKTTHSHFAGTLIKGHFENWLKKIWM